MQVPAWQNIPEPQSVPSATAGWAQVPLPSHASAVHGLPSSVQLAPDAVSTTVQPPLPSHVEASSQSVGSQVYAVPAQVSLLHASSCVHGSPSSQGAVLLLYMQPFTGS